MHFSARDVVDRKENHPPGEMQDDWKKQIAESERQKLSTSILQTSPKICGASWLSFLEHKLAM